MNGGSIFLASIAATLWGLSFIASAVALEALSPPQLTALRFMIAACPALVVARPPVAWTALVTIGLTLFAGQFLLLFVALAMGLPPGLASVTQQTQVLFSVVLAAMFLGDTPRRQSVAGMLIAFLGLGLIALSVGRTGPIAALAVGVTAAFSWAIGNVLIKRLGPVPMLPLVAWLSLIPPLPALAVSYSLSWSRLVHGDCRRPMVEPRRGPLPGPRRHAGCLRDLGPVAHEVSDVDGRAVHAARARDRRGSGSPSPRRTFHHAARRGNGIDALWRGGRYHHPTNISVKSEI